MNISIVVVEYYSLDELKTCIESLKKGFSFNVELIVSSNSCYDATTRKKVLETYPDVKWSFNERNGGFAYAMNNGLKLATGEYLIIANPDCSFHENLDPMVNFLINHPEIGAIAPQIIDEKGTLQDSCRNYLSVQSFVWRQVKRILLRKECLLDRSRDYSKAQTVDWIIGAFIMVPKKVYELTQGLSDDYFMYVEDEDWCTRIRKSGYEVVYYPKVKIQYKGTRSARSNKSSASVFYHSLLTYWSKYGYFFGYPKRKKNIFQ
ncbi:glycosyltransferase family 2 protein [uncultured Bacteroides sp.]|uniref:glycosyltransferase family 2 protein n=1 Tax=uncultured Bacteroides sp. TaxID=162156 RepID=UPI002AA6D8E6|nr:glycosyltransferase family 2 protein [uncultured Bacteroides sp.]